MRKKSKHFTTTKTKINETQKKSAREEKRDKTTRRHSENNKMTIRKSFPISNYFKYEWIKVPSQKTEFSG